MIRLPRLSSCRLIILLTLSLPLQVFSETELDTLLGSEDEFLAELPIILSATRLAQPLNEAPVAMTVIDREMIDASGARTIPDLLRLVPGFQVGYYDGNSPVAAYHGHSNENSKHVQVLVDGRSVYVPSLAGIPWQDMAINIDDIDRIEVIRGPNASSYGNNSFFGVVSIFTRHAIEDNGHKIKVTTGSQDTEDAYYSFANQSGELDYRVTVGTKNDNGTDELNDSTDADYLNYRLDLQIDTKNNLSYQGGLKDIIKGDHEPLPDHSIDLTYAFQQLKWEHQLSDKQSLSLQYYYNLHDQEELIKNVTIGDIDATGFGFPGTIIDGFTLASTLNIKSERHDIEFNHYYNGDKLRVVSGLSSRLDKVTANEVFDEDGSQTNYLHRAFLHGEYIANESWLLNAGMLLEKNDISGSDFSPRIAVIHHYNDNHSFRIGASRATRTPVLWEEHANYRLTKQLTQNGGQPLDVGIQNLLLGGTDILINQFQISSGNLESEEITSIELGYIAQLLNNRLTLDFKIFKDKTNQLITTIDDVFAPDDNFDVRFDGEPSPIADDFQNTHKTNSEGLEVSFNYQQPNNFRLYGYYAYIEIEGEEFNPLAHMNMSKRLSVSAPTNSYGLMLIKQWPKDFRSSLMVYHVREYDWMDRTRDRTSDAMNAWNGRNVLPYTKIDLKFDKIYNFGKEKLNLSLILQNLAEDFYDYNRTRYTDDTKTIPASPGNINNRGSLQDSRAYIEVSFIFN